MSNSRHDSLGDRMKEYEARESGRRFLPRVPIVARVDGRAFHSFTKGLRRPFDPTLHQCMISTTIDLVKETGAKVGYVQSDEISLVFYSDDPKSQIFFDGRIFKMTSFLAVYATLSFQKHAGNILHPDYLEKNPMFDARVWEMPNKEEVLNYLLWREWDATKNSVSMVAHEVFSNAELHKKNTVQKLGMLEDRGITWGSLYDRHSKRGTYVRRHKAKTRLTAAELGDLPPKHNLRQNPDLEIERTVVSIVDMPVFSKVLNQERVIFASDTPVIKEGSMS